MQTLTDLGVDAFQSMAGPVVSVFIVVIAFVTIMAIGYFITTTLQRNYNERQRHRHYFPSRYKD